ncbi:hypothetical protein G4H71_10010 [Rhodococcus triatomae]|uniref:Uncharacterized protein n=1 Tax=Rhodococcus triatomae TaxID=300028 RepID=A0A1G8QYP2_9NOCA|nr:DUF3566 domain-containing protein [Rhodococcus triatomae]QNG20763.1 hypothetical protein G4H72_20375 [Rhodococcus triatomae]QNG23321.1 hypothetical protein G4H71_10010 [Rhodococcus triatomae]SDJ09290.1 Transmembrane protein of unknown function [Rhodococcus triatomae]
MSTPHQPGSDKQTNGSASSTPPQKAPAQGNGAPAPQQGSRPGPPPKPQQGPAQQGSAGNANPKGQPPQGGRPGPAGPPKPPTTAPDRGRPPAARPQGGAPESADPSATRPAQTPAPGQKPAAPGAPGKQAPAPGPKPSAADKPAQQSPPPRPAASAPAEASTPKPDAPTEAAPAASARGVQGAPGKPAADRGTPQPPWQRGVQREPQTNLKRPGQPANGQQGQQPKGPAAPQGAKGQAPQQAKPVVTGTAAPGAREAAKAKTEAIDGPTRHISRKSLPTDMPDLSEAKHPTPAAAPAPAKAAVAVAPQRIAEGESLRAAVQLRRIDPWSMLKISSVISVSLFFVWMVAVGLLYVVLDGMGVWERLNNAFTDIVADGGTEGLVTAGQVFGYSAVIGLINMVLFTALATIGSFIYNLCADLVGGLEITLADRD